MTGKWIGWYEYDDVRAQLLSGSFRSGYTITIESMIGNNFSGSVSDDPATSAMHETGKVEGIIAGDKIYFT